MSNESILNDIAEARKLCHHMIQVEWPAGTDVIWLEIKKSPEEYEVCERASEAVVNEKIDFLLTRSNILVTMKAKFLDLGFEHFNVCQTLPDPSSLTVHKWPEKQTEVRKLWISPFNNAKEAIEQLVMELGDLWRDESLVLYGFPLTNDLCINVLYIIGQLFNLVGLIQPQGICSTILFYGYKKWNVSCERLLKKLCSKLTDLNAHELSISPNTLFYESKLYYYCVLINSILLKEQVLDILSNIDKSIENQTRATSIFAEPTLSEIEKDVDDNNNNMAGCNYKCSLHKDTNCSRTCSAKSDELEHLTFYLDQLAFRSVESEGNSLVLDFSRYTAQQILEIVKRRSKCATYRTIEVTQFCPTQLLDCYRRIIQISKHSLQLTNEDILSGSCLSIDIDEEILTCQKKYPWSSVTFEVKILDFGWELWMNIDDHASYQKIILQRIIRSLEDTWRSECLELRGFPLISVFNVSLVFILGHLFEEVRFLQSESGMNAIFFDCFKNCPRLVKEHLERSVALANDVVSLVPLRRILFGQFYEKIRNTNSLTLQKQCLHLLKGLSLQK